MNHPLNSQCDLWNCSAYETLLWNVSAMDLPKDKNIRGIPDILNANCCGSTKRDNLNKYPADVRSCKKPTTGQCKSGGASQSNNVCRLVV